MNALKFAGQLYVHIVFLNEIPGFNSCFLKSAGLHSVFILLVTTEDPGNQIGSFKEPRLFNGVSLSQHYHLVHCSPFSSFPHPGAAGGRVLLLFQRLWLGLEAALGPMLQVLVRPLGMEALTVVAEIITVAVLRKLQQAGFSTEGSWDSQAAALATAASGSLDYLLEQF